jgi:hypothetical protein
MQDQAAMQDSGLVSRQWLALLQGLGRSDTRQGFAMHRSARLITATLAGAATMSVGIAMGAPAYADFVCDTGSFCPAEDPDYGGAHFEIATNKSDWSTGSASAALVNKDSSWKNRYQSWYWACVYANVGYSSVSVWLPQGASYPRAQSGQRTNTGDSNRGLSSSTSKC